jgi:hypothetical protein
MRCLGICAVLKKVPNNIMVQIFRCKHEGRAATYCSLIDVGTELK